MNKLPQLIISAIIIVMALIIYFMPKNESSLSHPAKTSMSNSFNAGLIGEETDDEVSYGSIDASANSSTGYGYISDAGESAESFGSISFNNSNNDSLFKARVSSSFPNANIKYFSNSGISYATINDQQLYIENINVTEINGFNGPLDLAIVVNLNGNLDSVIYISSVETQSYLNKIFRANYFDQYHNVSLDKNHVIDAVSGATITTVAVGKSVNEIYNLSLSKNILSDYLMGSYKNFSIKAELNKIWILNLAILVLIFALVSFKKFRKKKILLAISIFSVAWLGFYLNSSFTYLLFVKMFSGVSFSIFTISYVALILASTVWSKNTYCKYICPFGNAQRLMFKISPFKGKKFFIKNKHLKYARYFVSAIVIIGYLAGVEAFSEFELFPYFFSVNTSYLVFAIAVVFMIISMRIPNFWCRALCPTGCVLDSISDISNIKIKELKK